MIKFNWELLESRVLEGGVMSIVWFKLTAIDEETGRTNAIQGSIQMDLDNPGDSFTPYDELTEEQVIGWLEASPHTNDFKKQLTYLVTEPIVVPVEDEPKFPWLK